jgi:integrase
LKYDRVRDIYCVGCLTGLRFSDLHQLKWEHIKDGFIYKTIQKQKEPLKIPVLAQTKGIFDKYKGQSIHVLPWISNQKLNEYIKKACEEAKITQPTPVTIFKGKTVTEVTSPKHDLITAHTARKTFITLSNYFGMDVKTIKSITGHKKDSTFDKYLKIADEMKKQKMEKAWGNI